MKSPTAHRWYRLHGWTIFALLVALASLTSGQICGELDGYLYEDDDRDAIITHPTPPAVGVRFGWPVVYQWRDAGAMSAYQDVGGSFTYTAWEDRWAWSDRDQLGFSAGHLLFDIAYSLMLLLGVGYTVERICRSSNLQFRFGFVALIAISGWAATLLVVDGNVKSLEDLLAVTIRVLFSFRYVILALFWFGVADVGCRCIARLSSR